MAFILFNYLHWVVVALMCKFFKYDTFLYYYGLKYLLNGQKWYRQSVVLTFASGPLFCLALGLLCIFIYSKLKKYKIVTNLFLVWGFIVGSAMFLSQAIVASLGHSNVYGPFWQDFAISLSWLGVPLLLVYAMNIPFALLLLYMAVNTARPFLIMAYSYSKVSKLSRRRKYFFETAIVPFVLGAIITTAVTFPENMYIHFVYLLVIAVILVIAWIALFYIEIMRDDVIKYKTLQSPHLFMLLVLALMIAFIKLTWKGMYL